jgi:protein gp37
MSVKTKIEWTDATWNPILGCSRVSEGCRHCYAEGIASRFSGGKETVYSGLTQIVNGHPQWTGKIVETRQLLDPLSWRQPKLVFVNSMSDLFHENVSDDLRDRIFGVMALAGHHTFQVLTKRAMAMLEYFAAGPMARVREAMVGFAASSIHLKKTSEPFLEWSGLPLPNVWLGVSVENQAAADERIPLLLQTPAAVRFISAEPLLGPINLENLPSASGIGRYLDALSNAGVDKSALIPNALDWVICGGESGPHARPMNPDWARSLRDQCAAASVPFFFKQWGEFAPGPHVSDPGKDIPIHCSTGGLMHHAGKKAAGSLLDGVEHKAFPEAR